MGRLLHLELENFKSYGGKHVVGPFDDFTCIVGPNGSGKSNMMDAISFVLGVQSKHLRSTHLKELIFRKDSRQSLSNKDIAAQATRKASVTLVYEVFENEVSGLSGGKQIIFSRVVTPTGASVYRLNGKEVSFEAYEKQLQAIGVLVKVRNFLVFQGDVESVASKSPVELTKLIEQISGSDAYRQEYVELYKSKEEAEEKTIASMQTRKFYANERRAVKDQRDEAELYMQRKQQCEELKTDYVLHQLLRIKTVLEEGEGGTRACRSELDAVRVSEAELETELATLKKELARSTKAVAAAEQDYNSKEVKLSDILPQLLETREKTKVTKRRQLEYEKAKGKMLLDLEQQKESVSALSDEIAALKVSEAALTKELTAISSTHVDYTADKLSEYAKLKTEAAALTAIQKTEAGTMEAAVSSKKQRLEFLRQQEAALTTQLAADETLLTSNKERSELLGQSIENSSKKQEELNKQKNKLDRDSSTGLKRLASCNDQLEVIQTKLRDAGDDRKRSKQEQKMVEAIETMKRIYGTSAVCGRLADLVDPIQMQYSTAVSVAMGKQLDAVVVESTRVAKECIRYLRDQHIGICSFIPLDNLGNQTASLESARQAVDACNRSQVQGHGQGQSYHLCVDLIQCEERFKDAVIFAVGATVVCDTLKHAQRMCFDKNIHVKAVTLTGHVISKSGAMTGGSSSSSSTFGHSSSNPNSSSSSGDGGSLSRFDDKSTDKLRRKKVELELEISTTKRDLPTRQQLIELETSIKQLANEAHYCHVDKQICDEKITQLTQQIALKVANLKELAEEQTRLKKEIIALEARLSDVQQKISSVENEIFGGFSTSVGVSNICEFESNKLKRHGEITRSRQECMEKLNQLTAQLAYEKQRDFQSAYTKLTTVTMKETASQLVELDKKEANILAQEEKLLAQKRQVDVKLTQVRAERDSAATRLKDLQQQRAIQQNAKESVSKRLAGLEITMERTRSQLHEVLKKALVEEVSLPTVAATAADSTSSSSSSSSKGAGASARTHGGSGLNTTAGAGDDSETDESQQQQYQQSEYESDSDLKWTGSVTAPSHDDVGATADDESDSAASSHSGNSGSDGGISHASSLSTHFSQTQNPRVQRDNRKAALVDLSSVRHLRRTPTQLVEAEKTLVRQIAQLQQEISSMQPNLHAVEKYEEVVEKLRECTDKQEEAKQAAAAVTERFEEVKRMRRQLFQNCFQHVSNSLSVIYKDLTRSSRHPLGGNAYLTLDNSVTNNIGGGSGGSGGSSMAGTGGAVNVGVNSTTSTADEPYLGGIRYTAMPPMKRFRDMDQLSGGEKTVAALALLFSIHHYKQAPFFVMDEIDAALDNVNVKKVCNYIRQRSRDFQCIVISLKDMFFEHADSLIGICKDVHTLSSQILTVKLSDYPALQNNDDNYSASGGGGGGDGGGRGSYSTYGTGITGMTGMTPSNDEYNENDNDGSNYYHQPHQHQQQSGAGRGHRSEGGSYAISPLSTYSPSAAGAGADSPSSSVSLNDSRISRDGGDGRRNSNNSNSNRNTGRSKISTTISVAAAAVKEDLALEGIEEEEE